MKTNNLKSKYFNKTEIFIPVIKRDGSLVSRLIVKALCGFDSVLDIESRLYLRLLVRLIDKSFDEYNYFRECLIEEIKSDDKLKLRFCIINHLENCMSALGRAGKIFSTLHTGKMIMFDHKNKMGIVLSKSLDVKKLINEDFLAKINKKNILFIRNRVEHIDQDIYDNSFKGGLFLDVDSHYKNICISDKSVSLLNLVEIIENYHNAVLEIFNGLPKKWENGKFTYEE